MAADSAGNNILAVGVAVTGSIGIGPYGTALPSATTGDTNPLSPALNAAIKKIGLLKKDGGPQFAWAADGDPIDFWQDGYSIPSGLANVTLTVTAAEALNPYVRQLVSGTAPDGTHNYMVLDGGGNPNKYVAFTEEIFKNGAIRRRAAPNISLLSATEDKNARGEVIGVQLVWTINRDLTLGGHFGEWVIPAAGA
jgi:hypothetical protein